MLIPYAVVVRHQRPPIANWVMIGVTCLISLMFFPILHGIQSAEELREAPTAVSLLLLQRGEQFNFFQLVGCMLSHADWWHLLGNMVFLFAFGNSVNGVMEDWEYLLLYVICGLVASFMWLAMGEGEASLGASGAIMGMMGACMVLYPLERVRVVLWLFIFVRNFEVPVGLLAVFYLAFDLIGFTSKNAGSVAYVAHLGGALAGGCLMLLLLGMGYIQTDRRHQNLLELVGMQ